MNFPVTAGDSVRAEGSPSCRGSAKGLTEVANGPEGYFANQRKRVLRGKLKPYALYRDERTFALHL